MKKAVIYTTKGDSGTTSLLRGERVSKDDVRVEAYGAVDELSAHIGLLQYEVGDGDEHCELLASVQNRLFAISASLADTASCAVQAVDDKAVKELESMIDCMEASLPPMRGFILPSLVKPSLAANICRTVCRRAERRIVTLGRTVELPPQLLAYMNRLSDYLFLLSRCLSVGNEKIWDNPCK